MCPIPFMLKEINVRSSMLILNKFKWANAKLLLYIEKCIYKGNKTPTLLDADEIMIWSSNNSLMGSFVIHNALLLMWKGQGAY